MHYAGGGGGVSMRGWHIPEVFYFGPYLVDDQQRGVLLAKPLELQPRAFFKGSELKIRCIGLDAVAGNATVSGKMENLSWQFAVILLRPAICFM